jgi:hypothetical protein
MTYKDGDLVDEAKIRAELASARERYEAASEEYRRAGDAVTEAGKALASAMRGRWPREDELTYALGAKCGDGTGEGCGAPLAYWPDLRPQEWLCADVLLGRVGTPEDKALVVERSIYAGQQPPAPPGKVLHDKLPFSCWSIKSDRDRKTRDVPLPTSSDPEVER